MFVSGSQIARVIMLKHLRMVLRLNPAIVKKELHEGVDGLMVRHGYALVIVTH